MRFARPALLLLPTILSCVSVAAQTPPRDPQALTVMRNALAALGGSNLPESRGGRTSLVATGTYTRFVSETPVSSPFRVRLLGLNRIRWETDRSDGTFVTVVVGRNGRTRTPQRMIQLAVGQLSGKALETQPVLALFDWLNSMDVGLRYAGMELIQGRNLHRISLNRTHTGITDPRIRAAYEQMSRCDVYVDPQTFLPVRLRYYEHPGDWRRDIPVDLVFADFRILDGVLLPFVITRFFGPNRLDEYRFQSFTFGASVSESEFILR